MGNCAFNYDLISAATGYAQSFLQIVASIYPGYSISVVGSIIGFIYGFIDAFVALYIFAWIYNKLNKQGVVNAR